MIRMTITFERCLKYAVLYFIFCLLPEAFSGYCHAAQVTLAWDANSEPEVAGYKLYSGPVSRTYDRLVDVGNVTRYTVTGIEEGKTIYFAVTAYDATNESAFSEELECFTLVPSAGPNGVITPAGTVVASRVMSVTFRAIPADNYAVSDVLVDAVSVGAVTSYTFSSVQANHRISASFVRIPYGSLGSFNGDANPDILGRNVSTGQIYVLYMNGESYTGGVELPALADQSWAIVGTGDFNGDGKPDILWRNIVSGENCIWFINEATCTGVAVLPTLSDQNWTIVGTGDFNSDSNLDILWRNTASGENVVWYMAGASVVGVGDIPAVPFRNWAIVSTGDFNGDDKPDILWRNTASGENSIWFMDGTTCTGVGGLPTLADQSWTIVGTGDFNSDGKLDILWMNILNGETYVWYMNGVTCTDTAYLFTVGDLNWMIF